VASHVRRVRVPSQASDVDQFLDDLFMPVLDNNAASTVGGDQASTLAASIKGGGRRRRGLYRAMAADQAEASILAAAIKGGNDSSSASSSEDDEDESNQRKKSSSKPGSAMGFQIPGRSKSINWIINQSLITSGLVSPTPLSPPPPAMFMPQQQQQGQSDQNGAMAFTYVPVPVYNLAAASAGQPQAAVGQNQPMAFPQSPVPPSPSKDQDQQQLLQQQQAYQQAFLQNAVAQNMQIQQQLMMQNQVRIDQAVQALATMHFLLQALAQLLNSGQGGASGQPGAASFGSMIGGVGTPMPSMFPTFGQQPVLSEQNQPRAGSRASVGHRPSKVQTSADLKGQAEAASSEDSPQRGRRSTSTPATPGGKQRSTSQHEMSSGALLDQYRRDRTVRIGKWRWPPPKEEGQHEPALDADAEEEGFLAFKMRKMREKEVEEEENRKKKKVGDDDDWGESKPINRLI